MIIPENEVRRSVSLDNKSKVVYSEIRYLSNFNQDEEDYIIDPVEISKNLTMQLEDVRDSLLQLSNESFIKLKEIYSI